MSILYLIGSVCTVTDCDVLRLCFKYEMLGRMQSDKNFAPLLFGNTKQYIHFGKEFGQFLIKLTYPREMKFYVHTKSGTQMFITLFIMPPRWNYPEALHWVNLKQWLYIHTIEYYSAIK